jgi:hypothetical protein
VSAKKAVSVKSYENKNLRAQIIRYSHGIMALEKLVTENW